MYRTHNCNNLKRENLNESVTLSGWVQKTRNKGFIIWIDLRDRYGITQLVFDEERTPEEVFNKAKALNREFVIQVKGIVLERGDRIYVGVFPDGPNVSGYTPGAHVSAQGGFF